MEDAVERAPALLDVVDDGGDVVGVVDVELEDVGRVGQAVGDPLRDPHPAAEAGEHDLRAFLLRALGDGVGDRALGEDPGDEQAAAFEQHGVYLSARGARSR